MKFVFTLKKVDFRSGIYYVFLKTPQCKFKFLQKYIA